jgi:hypothetical protein
MDSAVEQNPRHIPYVIECNSSLRIEGVLFAYCYIERRVCDLRHCQLQIGAGISNESEV